MDRSSEVASEADEVADAYNALIHLHSVAGSFGDMNPGDHHPGLKPVSTESALETLAATSIEEVPQSTRLAIIYALIRADPEIQETARDELLALTETVAHRNELDAETLLADISSSAIAEEPLSSTDSGKRLKHVAAFIGQDVCQIGKVQVNGIDATWIFSEFETDANFDGVASWVDPHNWPKYGPLLFKTMEPVGGGQTTPINTLSPDHWHGVFHEEVQLLRPVNTLLHCDYWRDGNKSAGMTYELDHSIDKVINVDRGFLLVNKVDGVCRVKALKIVGFTDNLWDWVASWVCPFWTDFVRAAVEDGSTSEPSPAPEEPAGESPTDMWGDLFAAWMEFFGESGKAYLDLFGDTFSRATSGDYTADKWVEDGTKAWSQLAKDWAKAWSYSLDLVEDVKEQGLDASFMPPDMKEADPGRGKGMARTMMATSSTSVANSTLIPIPGHVEGATPECSELSSIEEDGPVIPADAVRVNLETLPDGQTPGARISTGPNVTPGLYVGSLKVKGIKDPVPAQIYVSGARRQSGG